MKKKWFLIGLSLSLCLSSSVFAVENDEISELEEKVNQSEKKQEELNEQLESVHKNIHSVEKELAIIKKDIEDTEYKILVLENELTEKKDQIKKKEKQIKSTKNKLEKKRLDLGNSLLQLDQAGEMGFLEFVIQSFEAENLSEILSALEFLQSIRDANKQMFDDFKEQEAKLQKQKKELNNEKVELDEKKKEQDDLMVELDAKKEEQDILLAEFKSQESKIIQHIQEEENAQAALNDAIAEAIKKREEQKKKEQEERERQNESKLPPLESGDVTFAMPMKEGTYYISSGYGWRTHPVHGDERLHNGTDFAATEGTPIYAIGDGYVIYSGEAKGYGNWIVIEHPNGYYSIYGHMEYNQLYVSEGEQVTKGQHIAGIGNSGTSTGPHLHLAISTGLLGDRTFGGYIDPMTVLK